MNYHVLNLYHFFYILYGKFLQLFSCLMALIDHTIALCLAYHSVIIFSFWEILSIEKWKFIGVRRFDFELPVWVKISLTWNYLLPQLL